MWMKISRNLYICLVCQKWLYRRHIHVLWRIFSIKMPLKCLVAGVISYDHFMYFWKISSPWEVFYSLEINLAILVVACYQRFGKRVSSSFSIQPCTWFNKSLWLYCRAHFRYNHPIVTNLLMRRELLRMKATRWTKELIFILPWNSFNNTHGSIG